MSVADYIAQSVQPVAVQTPLDIARQHIEVQGAQQQQQLNALKIQQEQRAMASQAAIQKAFTDANGDLDQTLALAPRYGALPSDIVGLQQHVLTTKKTIADLDKDQLETHQKHVDIAAGQVNSLLGLPEDQAAAQWPGIVQGLIKSKDIKPGELPDQYPGHQGLQQYLLGANGYKNALTAEQKNREIAAQEKTATARQQQADTAQQKAQAELPGLQADAAQKQRVQDAEQLSAAARQGPEALRAAMDAMPHGRARTFIGLTTPEDIAKAALTPEQSITAANAAAGRTETGRHNAVEEAARNKQLGIEGARLALERQKAGFEMGGGVSPAAQMAADGRMDPATLRSMLRRSPGMLPQILQVDPQFDEGNIDKRYSTLKEFTASGNTKAGGQVVALNTLIHHANLYMDAADAMKNGSFRPGNAAYNTLATMFGSAPPNNAALVARFLAGETGKVATGGVPAEGEIKGILSSLGTNASPDQMKQAGQMLLQVAAGKMEPLQFKVKDAKLDKLVTVISPDSQAILQKRGFDPNTMKPVAATNAATTPQYKAGDTRTVNGVKYVRNDKGEWHPQ